MKGMKQFFNDLKNNDNKREYKQINTTIQQMAKRNDEIVKIITNTLPKSVDRLQHGIHYKYLYFYVLHILFFV